MALQKLPLEKVFMLVESGPILLIATDDGRKNNIMTITQHVVPDLIPQIALTTGLWNHSFQVLRDMEGYVPAAPTAGLTEKAVAIGDCSDAVVDKFRKLGLTPLPGLWRKAPLILGCLACLECYVPDYVEPYGIFILQGAQAWMDLERRECRTFRANGNGTFRVDGETLCLRSLMEDRLPPDV